MAIEILKPRTPLFKVAFFNGPGDLDDLLSLVGDLKGYVLESESGMVPKLSIEAFDDCANLAVFDLKRGDALVKDEDGKVVVATPADMRKLERVTQPPFGAPSVPMPAPWAPH